MHQPTNKHWLGIAVLVTSIVFWTVLLWRFSPEEIIDFVGVENGYLIMFLVSTLGGVSSFGVVSYIATLITLASGGLNPLLLGLASGAGISIGDSLYFLLGRFGRKHLGEGSIANGMKRFAQWLDAKPDWFVPIVVFAYTAFTPLPNDLLAIAMGLSGRKYIPIIIALVLGNITLTILVATFGMRMWGM